MGGLSLWHWLVILGVVLLLLGGAGKISGLMEDVAKGVGAFRENEKDSRRSRLTILDWLALLGVAIVGLGLILATRQPRDGANLGLAR